MKLAVDSRVTCRCVEDPIDSGIYVFRGGCEGEVWIKVVLGAGSYDEAQGCCTCPFQFVGWGASVIREAHASSKLDVLRKATQLIWAELAVMQHHYGGVVKAQSDGRNVDLSDFQGLAAGLKDFYEGHYEKAYEPLKPYANLGVPVCESILGNCYQFGFGAEVDPQRAIQWYRRAAAQGDAIACQSLGTILLAGEKGVERDVESAAYFFELAVELGIATVAQM